MLWLKYWQHLWSYDHTIRSNYINLIIIIIIDVTDIQQRYINKKQVAICERLQYAQIMLKLRVNKVAIMLLQRGVIRAKILSFCGVLWFWGTVISRSNSAQARPSRAEAITAIDTTCTTLHTVVIHSRHWLKLNDSLVRNGALIRRNWMILCYIAHRFWVLSWRIMLYTVC